ncbi:MAG: glycoside hydrolase family 15 protein [Myxococcota bacterium]
MAETHRQPNIGEYAPIGDAATVALVSRDGSIDWLCWPHFHSPSLFAALLDPKVGGRFAIRPAASYRVDRRYRGATALLETTFHTDGGVLRLTDLMVAEGTKESDQTLCPDHQIVRRIECLEGEVEVDVVCDPRPDYGRKNPRLEKRGRLGFFYNEGAEVFLLRSEVPLEEERPGVLVGREQLRAGETRRIILCYDVEEPAVVPPLGDFTERRVAWTEGYWLGWFARCTYDGPYRDAVVRSAITLKLLSYSGSGALVAAATTSLPEVEGGQRNWDYRYCWIRDAVFTLRALVDLGYRDEGAAFFDWLLYTIRRTAPQVNVLYDVFGRTDLDEETLDHLAGYRGSRPVRIGNAAATQFQLDVYGEVVSTAYEFVRHGGMLDRWQKRMIEGFGRVVCDRWRLPDEGIWEMRSERVRHTYSNVMCWVALDRLIRLAEEGHCDVPVGELRSTCRQIRDEVEAHGFNEQLGSYVASFDGDRLDASLLLLPLYGYCDAGAPRMRATYETVRERLGVGPLLYRYESGIDDGLPGAEGAFGICGFWAVEYLAAAGRVDEARSLFESLLAYATDAGLYAEEIDPDTGEPLGNFPQAFTHVGLINAALGLEEGFRRGRAEHEPREEVDDDRNRSR